MSNPLLKKKPALRTKVKISLQEKGTIFCSPKPLLVGEGKSLHLWEGPSLAVEGPKDDPSILLEKTKKEPTVSPASPL